MNPITATSHRCGPGPVVARVDDAGVVAGAVVGVAGGAVVGVAGGAVVGVGAAPVVLAITGDALAAEGAVEVMPVGALLFG